MISHDVIVCLGFWQVDVAALPSMEELIGQFASLTHIKKIGEGTFGEAFKADQVQPCPFAPLQAELCTVKNHRILRRITPSYTLPTPSAISYADFDIWNPPGL